MFACPTCEADLEMWQIECHHCGQAVSSDAIPIVHPQEVSKKEIQAAFSEWMKRGKDLYKRKSYDEAHACFAEALTRVSGLDSQRTNEIKARVSLGNAFGKLRKNDEAVEQFVIAESLSENSSERDRLRKKIDKLNTGRKVEVSKEVEGELGIPDDTERVSSLLFCVSCSRLLAEAEVYRFRSSKSEDASCICGFTGVPLAHKSEQIDMDSFISSGLRSPARKERLIEAAQKPIKSGRTKVKAFWFALVLGTFGAHKFYLGDRARGIVYILLAWTFIPLVVSIFEAILIAQMSRVSFNLAYNIEGVLERLPIDSLLDKANSQSLISMEVTDEPDDVVDEWSLEDETNSDKS